ncbi:hypothetical protein [Rhodoblastus sp.]|uniref:hypothetical protein n=1 Tax=Rhodoblastus sp. TaxID=1962975 RepID=UPI003F948B03
MGETEIASQFMRASIAKNVFLDRVHQGFFVETLAIGADILVIALRLSCSQTAAKSTDKRRSEMSSKRSAASLAGEAPQAGIQAG